MNGICYIISAGESTGINFLKNENDYVIAVDGGFETAKESSLNVDCIMGDFDSLGYVPAGENVICFSSDKEDTDTMLAIKKGMEFGYDRFIIFGALGKREDHTLANLLLLKYLSKRNCKAVLVGKNEKITAVTDGTLNLTDDFYGADCKSKYFSVFSIDEKSCGVIIKNAKYEVNDIEMTNDYPIGISNEYLSDVVTEPNSINNYPIIGVKKGTLIVSYDISD